MDGVLLLLFRINPETSLIRRSLIHLTDGLIKLVEVKKWVTGAKGLRGVQRKLRKELRKEKLTGHMIEYNLFAHSRN